MKAADVMVSNVITVRPDNTVQDVAKILLARRISAVPVVDEGGRLVGIISEADLIRRVETGTNRRRSSWLELLTGNAKLAEEYIKANARKVVDVMTQDVVTAAPDAPLKEIARLLEKHQIKRVPIVEDGKVVGIVSRANLLQGLASQQKETAPAGKGDDSALREKVIRKLNKEPWAPLNQINVTVHQGVVNLWGIVESPQQKEAIRVAAEITPGVRSVNDNLMVGMITAG